MIDFHEDLLFGQVIILFECTDILSVILTFQNEIIAVVPEAETEYIHGTQLNDDHRTSVS